MAVSKGLVYAVDLTGYFHCVDFKTARRVWTHDLLAEVWVSPMVVDGRVLVGDSDGVLTVFAEGRKLKVIKSIDFDSAIFSTPTIANGLMYIRDHSKRYGIELFGRGDKQKATEK